VAQTEIVIKEVAVVAVYGIGDELLSVEALRNQLIARSKIKRPYKPRTAEFEFGFENVNPKYLLFYRKASRIIRSNIAQSKRGLEKLN
jgi:hypothetical protein